MLTPFYRIYSIEKEQGQAALQHFQSEESISDYIQQVVEEDRSHHDRNYKFRNDDTFFPDCLKRFIPVGANVADICQEIANRLLDKEIAANKQIAQTKKTIPESYLIVVYTVSTEGLKQFLFIKADKDSFINSVGNTDTGLPKKRKIFKSCVFEVNINEVGELEINNIISHDANSQGKSVYWYHDFLCLEELRTDEKNTKEAYDQIKKHILNPIKKDHKHDYITIRNSIIHYFRSEGDFDIDYFRDNVIGSYHPFDTTLNIDELKKKVNKLSSSDKIDNRFQKCPDAVKDKFKETVKLTDDIELHLLQDIQNVRDVIQAGSDNGRKYIKIYSDEGYEYAESLRPE